MLPEPSAAAARARSRLLLEVTAEVRATSRELQTAAREACKRSVRLREESRELVAFLRLNR